MPTPAIALIARHARVEGGRWLSGGGVLLAAGRIERILASPAAARRAGAPRADLGDVVLLPGFVNAHAHLELSGLAGCVPPGRDFPDWIRALLVQRERIPRPQLERATRAAAKQLLVGGTTAVGDIDATGRLLAVTRGLALRVRRYREALDAGDPRRAPGALASVERAGARRRLWSEGLSPHAPYTVSDRLLADLGRRARARRLPIAIHWAETPEERLWLEQGRGPFAALLSRSPRGAGLDRIAAAGLLGPRTALIHGNDATPAERARVAQSGATLVHCPGTHAFFGRPDFAARAWRAAGVPLALGTDSLASNLDLDMAREMALFRASHPDFSPAETLDLATCAAARAIGFEGRAGALAVGAWADLAAHEAPGRTGPERLDALTRGLGRVVAVWTAGRRVPPHASAGI
ncbi:MAG: amidohydrolase family protein [Planctomycetes bacterium]|nr:amidohydrolase family protein [Planctomycetota bacterium]